ncbi:MAG: ABC transporter permease, partial [Ginsengibacter sp.]
MDDKNIKALGQCTGKDYFNIFSFKLIEGNKNSVLENKSSIVISDELAKKLFSAIENIIGNPVRFDQDTTFYVSGVFEKVSERSSQQIDFGKYWGQAFFKLQRSSQKIILNSYCMPVLLQFQLHIFYYEPG